MATEKSKAGLVAGLAECRNMAGPNKLPDRPLRLHVEAPFVDPQERMRRAPAEAGPSYSPVPGQQRRNTLARTKPAFRQMTLVPELRLSGSGWRHSDDGTNRHSPAFG